MSSNENIPQGNWDIIMFLIKTVLLLIVLGFGYFLLEDHIHEFANRKKYSTEELARLSERIPISLQDSDPDRIVKGIHVRTGLHDDPNLQTVIASCTSCHSAKLITQNRATREGWQSMFRWMQETQGLPNLGKTEPILLDYLAKYYAPTKTGRRPNLDMEAIEWYILNLETDTKN